MLTHRLAEPEKKGLTILLLGAHCDDIEIGCGGTLLNLIRDYKINKIMWVVFTSNGIRKQEGLVSAKKFLKHVKNIEVQILDFKDGYLPAYWGKVKDEFEIIKENINPNIIFTHYRNDLHQDHHIINEITWNTFTNHLIYEYEIPKYDGDLGNPNYFVALDREVVNQKKDIILNSFKSQLQKQWLDDTLLTSTMRIRGVECASESKYAEAFYSRKMIL